jgi:hypothetical protein
MPIQNQIDKNKFSQGMSSNHLNAEKLSLKLRLQSKCEQFDYALELEDDCESAKIIYVEIKTLRERLEEMKKIYN